MIYYIIMRILITGAAQGIGLAIANILSPNHELYLFDLKDVPLQGDNVHTFKVDLTNPEEIAHAIESLEIDCLINNAGIAHEMKPVEELSVKDFDLTFDVNLRAPFLLTKYLIGGMKERGEGLILNIASSANIFGYKNHSLYAASKAALISFTESVAKEVEGTSIRAVSILPSRTNTPMNTALRGNQEAENSQPAEYVADVIRQIVEGELQVSNGDDVRIQKENVKVEANLV
jgi:NAD(P)-dependent dehydrogenase (short-subunit alcohol dehydrogenase family)